MSGGLSVGSLGYNLYNDPAFWAAANTPNPNQVAFKRAQNYAAQEQDASQFVPVGQPEVAQQEPEPEKKNNTWKWVLGTAVIVGAGIFLRRRGNGSIIEGAKSLINRAEGGVTAAAGKGKGAKKSVIDQITSKKATIRDIGGKTVVTMPGQKNVLAGKNITAELGKIGETAQVEDLSKLADPKTGKLLEGNEIKNFYKDYNEVGHRLWYSNGKFGIWDIKAKKDITGEILTKDPNGAYANYKSIVDMITKGEVEITKTGLDRVVIVNKNAEKGLETSFAYLKKNDIYNGDIIKAVSDKFALDSDAVKIARFDKESFNDALKLYESGKFKELNVLCGGFKTDVGTFTVNNKGKVIQVITKDGKKLEAGTPEFKVFCQTNRELYDKASEQQSKKLVDRIFEAAA